MTAEEFAKRVGRSPGMISKTKNGRVPSAKILGDLERWGQVLGLTEFKAKTLREAAHLARSTPVIRALVTELRVSLSQMGDQIEKDRSMIADHAAVIMEQKAMLADQKAHLAEQKALTALLIKLMRGKGIEIPEDISDRL